MTKKSYLVVALALWMILVALLGPAVQALPNHVVTGGVFGPGGNVQPGPGNPANAAGAVYYSTNQPGYPVLTEAVLTPADGTLPASFATDVGASWDWLPGDEVVVVVETVRGVNLWAGVNYTTSVDGVLQLSGAIQDIGNGALEQLPPLTLIAGSDYVNVTWTGLADANGNVASYIVFRGPGPMGPFNPVSTVAQRPAGAESFNNTGLTPGQYCYNLAVNYRRDTLGGTYTTAGRSETTCVLATGAPYIVSTSPANGATGVARSAPVDITFNEAMDTATVTATFAPLVTGVGYSWNANTVTVTHALFAAGTQYQVTVTGQDLGGSPLGPGPVPNPFRFTTNTPPTAVLTAPGVGVCRTGGSNLDITWTMSDPETTTANLRVWLNYSDGLTTNPIAGVQGTSGHTSPETYTWTTPTIDASVTITLEVLDGSGEKAQETSPSVQIDSTRPTVLNINPANSATTVPTDAAIWVNFSESMDRTATQTAFSISQTVAGATFTWSNGNATLRVTFTSLFAADTQYTVTIGTGAKDDCTPGLTLAVAFTSGFRTGQGPALLAPNPPTSLQVTSATQTAVGLSWVAPTDYTDGRPLSAGDIVGYDVYRSDSPTGTKTKVGSDVTALSFTDTTVQAGATYVYWVKAKHRNAQESDFSASVTATTPAQAGIEPWLIGLIIVVIILAVVGAVLLMRRKKPEKPVEAPPEEPAPAPVEEAPSAEPAPPEEGEGPGGST